MNKPPLTDIQLGEGVIPGSVREKDIEAVTEVLTNALKNMVTGGVDLDTEVTLTLTLRQLATILFEMRWYTWSDNDIQVLRQRLRGCRELLTRTSQNR